MHLRAARCCRHHHRHRRNVADNNNNMLLPLIQVAAATLLLFATISNATPTPVGGSSRAEIAPSTKSTAATATTTTSNATAATSRAATTGAAAAAALVDGEVIGATSLAAAAGAAAAIAPGGGLAMARSTGSSSNEIIGNSANLLLENLQQATGHHIVNLTRHHDGDVFHTSGVTSCNADTCVGLTSGTAGLLQLGGDRNDNAGRAKAVGALAGSAQSELMARRIKPTAKDGRAATQSENSNCQCRCLPYSRTYREDLGICVDDIHECSLSPFVSGSSSEKIPFVFLPLRGQIIYPSREISFPEIRTPVCAVTGAQYLTTNGWSELRNPIDTDYPFRMFRDEGRTFLQWLGESDLRQKMQGRLIVVHLVCRDMTIALNATTKDQIMSPKNVFSPCVAFRVNGTPVKYTHNVSEVLFQSEATTTLASTSDGMTTKEYVVIGVCSLLLGLIYVSSVFLYLHMKKRKSRGQSHMRNSLDDLANEINYPRNDQVTFGAPFNRSGSLYSANSLATSGNEPRSRASIGSLKEDGMGIVKSNPLLQHFPQLGEHHSGFASDISNSNSECEMDGGYHDKLKQMQTSALVHPQMGMGSSSGSPSGSHKQSKGNGSGEDTNESTGSPTQENECLPVENVSIVEDMMTEEKLEHLRAMVNGNVRKKLYFNPAYFEPHLLAQPPPAAVEFLQKIREVIAIAKYKMATKRYQPSLIMIPEENALRSDTPSLYETQPPPSTECLGCVNNRCSGHIKNCGDKRNSIEQWLLSVTATEDQKSNSQEGNRAESAKTANGTHPDRHENGRRYSPPKPPHTNVANQQEQRRLNSTGHATPQRKELTPPKQRPPPPPAPCSGAQSDPQRSNKSLHSSSINASHNSYQLYCTSIATGPSVTIPVNRSYESFSALSAAANIYGFAETGSEIYNNPKFNLHDSPNASQRSQSSHRSKSSARKRLDALDQYAAASTPTSLTSAERHHYDMLRNMKQMPHMLYDAIARDYQSATLTTNGSFQLDIPTPDYDSTMEKKIKDIYNNTQSSAPSVPTPDYSTLSRKSLKQYQPDSPIYRRKSPQYLIVDYETDSLERLEATKRKSSQSSSSPSSDVSSQLSPSLSTALPLEEELEISHTVYNKMDGFRKEVDVVKKKVLLAKTDSNASSKQKEIATRIKYDTPFRGSMTIEVEHEPQSDLERSTDSDQFEPDTLDRKPKKQSFCDVSAWSEHHLKKSQHSYGDEVEPYAHLNNAGGYHAKMSPNLGSTQPTSMPNVHSNHHQPFVLKASNSFRSDTNKSPTYESQVELRLSVDAERRPSVGSLRELYQSPLVRQNSQQSCKCGGQAASPISTRALDMSEQGRLLTLEAKQKRRQQVVTAAVPPPVVEITQATASNKTTIKITTPKVSRAAIAAKAFIEAAAAVAAPPKVNNVPPTNSHAGKVSNQRATTKTHYDIPKNSVTSGNSVAPTELPAVAMASTPLTNNTPASTLNSTASKDTHKKRATRSPPPLPPPPPPPTSASTTLNSQKSVASSQHSVATPHPHYQNQNQYMHHSTTTEEETMSNHSESTEFTRVSDTVANSEFENSVNNTLSKEPTGKLPEPTDSAQNTIGKLTKCYDSPPSVVKKLQAENDYGAMFNTQINGLRSDYSLTKYLNRRKSQELEDEQSSCNNDTDSQRENNNNNLNAKNVAEVDANKLDVLSISSRSNRSSSRLSDRTKEMYRNAGVPVGIAYPQRSAAANISVSANPAAATPPPPVNNVQTVYRCEIEPVQLTHGMQIAMGLKDRAKKAKDLKNAWKKFVSMAAAKFSPTHSPAPPFDKKTPSFLEVLDRDEGISSLIDEHPRVSTPKSSYSAPASQNYYEQRFGSARTQEMDSGYMSADSGEVYKRSFYDRYNFKMMSGRDHVIRVDTIEDNSDGGSTLTDRHNGLAVSARRASILDSNRFEDFEHMGEPPANELTPRNEVASDAESDKTLTHSSNSRRAKSRRADTRALYSSEDEQGNSPSYGSSETDGETNAEDMWESGAESIETHSVLYKNVRKN